MARRHENGNSLEEHLHLGMNTPFIRRSALFAGLLAALLGISSWLSSNASNEMLLYQQKAADQWSYYQGKTTKEYILFHEAKSLELNLAQNGDRMSPQVKKLFDKALQNNVASAKQMRSEAHRIQDRARRYEALSKENLYRGNQLGYSEIMLQIAIVLTSVAILSQSFPILSLAAVLSAAGLLQGLNALFIWIRF